MAAIGWPPPEVPKVSPSLGDGVPGPAMRTCDSRQQGSSVESGSRDRLPLPLRSTARPPLGHTPRLSAGQSGSQGA